MLMCARARGGGDDDSRPRSDVNLARRLTYYCAATSITYGCACRRHSNMLLWKQDATKSESFCQGVVGSFVGERPKLFAIIAKHRIYPDVVCIVVSAVVFAWMGLYFNDTSQ